MKHIYTLILALLCIVSGRAQSNQDYYVDIQNDNNKYYFEWDASINGYVLHMDMINNNFKIYSSQYVQGGSNQDQYIFGAAEGQTSGITEETTKGLAHPGADMQIEGGKVLYNPSLYFFPDKMLLYIVNGSFTPVENPGIDVEILSAIADSSTTGTVEYTIIPTKIDNAESLSYNVTLVYNTADGSSNTLTATLTGNLTGTFTLTDLKEDAETTVTVTAVTTYNDKQYTGSDTDKITTVIPILIGQISGHEWVPNYGIKGEAAYFEGKNVYIYDVTLASAGEFSFVTKLGTSTTDWNTVNAFPRLAPSSYRVAIPSGTWMPFSVYEGSTENAWTIQNFNADNGHYDIIMDPSTRTVTAFTHEVMTGVEDVAAAESHPVDVYNLLGVKVRGGADSLNPVNGLPAGIYVVEGHKYIAR